MGADVILMGCPPQPLRTPRPPAQVPRSLIGQEDAEVLLQAKKLGQVHG